MMCPVWDSTELKYLLIGGRLAHGGIFIGGLRVQHFINTPLKSRFRTFHLRPHRDFNRGRLDEKQRAADIGDRDSP